MQSLNLIIFPEQAHLKTKQSIEFSEPNWAYLFFLKYKPEFQQEILNFCEKTHSSYSFFLQGIAKEYGIIVRKNLNQALTSYKEGAELNDPYCHFKLYFIYNDDFQKYHVQRNRDLAISHLIQSAAFWDPHCSNQDLMLHINPRSRLGILLENEDEKLVKIRLLIHKYFKSNNCKYIFFTNWIMIQYPFEADLAEFHMSELIIFAENTEFPEACFYYGNYLRETYSKTKTLDLFNQSQELLLMATKANIIKAFYPLAQLYEQAKMSQEAINILKKGGKLGCFSCLHNLAHYYSIGMNTPRNFQKAIKYAFRAFILGDLTAGHTFKDIGCYMKSVGLDERVDALDRKIYLIAENLSETLGEFNPTLHKVGADVYLLVKCYVYGINCYKDLKKGLKLINNAIEEHKIEDNKYLIYTKARILMQMELEYEDFITDAFKSYESFVNNEKNKKFPQHFYRMGKFFEKGWGVGKNKKEAKEFYKKGILCIEEKPNMCWMQFLYMQKCRTKLNELEHEQ